MEPAKKFLIPIGQLTQLQNQDCSDHPANKISVICCHESCHRPILCVKCIISDIDHYTKHKPQTYFKSINEVKEMYEVIVQEKDVDHLMTAVIQTLKNIPKDISNVISSSLETRIEKLIEEKLQPNVMDCLVSMDAQDLKIYLEKNHVATNEIGQALFHISSQDTFHKTKQITDSLAKEGTEEWIQKNLIGKDEKKIQQHINRIASMMTKNLRKVLNLIPLNQKVVRVFQRYTTQQDPYPYNGKNGVCFECNKDCFLLGFGHYARIDPQGRDQSPLNCTFYIIPGRSFTPNTAILTQTMDLNAEHLKTSLNQSPILSDLKEDTESLTLPPNLIYIDFEDELQMEKETVYSLWYEYEAGIPVRQYWGDGGPATVQQPNGTIFKFTRVQGGDSGDNNSKWGQFNSFIYYTPGDFENI